MQKARNYFRDSLQEFRHVTWPTKTQTQRLTITVIAFVSFSAIFFGFADYLFSLIFTF